MLRRSVQSLSGKAVAAGGHPDKGWINHSRQLVLCALQRTPALQPSNNNASAPNLATKLKFRHGSAGSRSFFASSSFFPAFHLISSEASSHGVRFFKSTSSLHRSKKNDPEEGNPKEPAVEKEDEAVEEGEEKTPTEVVVQRSRGQVLDENSTQLVRQDPNWIPKEVLVIPVFRRPIFPGIATPIALTNPEFCEYMLKLKNESGSYPHIGLFLTKDRQMEEGKLIQNLDEIHEIGCLGQIVHVQGVQQLGMQLLVAGAGRILITGAVRKDPFLTVSVERLSDKPFDPSDKIIKAWMLEVMSTLKSIVKLEHLFKEQLQTILNQVDVSNPGLLADITTSMTTADRGSLQKVLPHLNSREDVLFTSGLDVLTSGLDVLTSGLDV